jgi:hypothetical protein
VDRRPPLAARLNGLRLDHAGRVGGVGIESRLHAPNACASRVSENAGDNDERLCPQPPAVGRDRTLEVVVRSPARLGRRA